MIAQQLTDVTSNFNPRSLAGATFMKQSDYASVVISIHAPSRERPFILLLVLILGLFQSTLPRGSDLES